MAKNMRMTDWNTFTIQPNTRCRIETPTIPPTNAIITRMDKQQGTIRIFGKTHEREAGEQPLAQIDTHETKAELQTSALDGIILKWSHPGHGNGTLMTFPRRTGQV